MSESIGDFLRKNVQADFNAVRRPASEVFQEVIKMPAQPSPQQQFSDFMKKTQQERLAMATQMGAENYQAFTDEMINIGVDVMGQSAENLRTYLDQDMQLLNQQQVASQQEQQYASLIDASLAKNMSGFEDASSIPAEIPPTGQPAGGTSPAV